MQIASADHSGSTKAYYIVYAALILLLAATVGIAYIHFGVFNIPLALLVATVKAVLVIWIFMHVRESSPVVLLCIGGTILMLGIGLTLLLSDYLTR